MNDKSEAHEVEAISETALPAVPLSSDVAAQVEIAHRYPRNIKEFRSGVQTLASLTEEIAAECSYALPRAGETIIGPSARFAEILASQYKHLRVATRIVDDTGTFIVAEADCWDIQANVGRRVTVRRRIVDKKGRRYSEDMIGTTANAAASIAARNAVCQTIPKALWADLWEKARAVAVGDASTLSERRVKALAALARFGVTQQMVLDKLDRPSTEDITVSDLEILLGVFNALKEGDSTVEELFKREGAPEQSSVTSGGQALKDALAKKQTDAAQQPATSRPVPSKSEQGFTFEEIVTAIEGATTDAQLLAVADLIRTYGGDESKDDRMQLHDRLQKRIGALAAPTQPKQGKSK